MSDAKKIPMGKPGSSSSMPPDTLYESPAPEVPAQGEASSQAQESQSDPPKTDKPSKASKPSKADKPAKASKSKGGRWRKRIVALIAGSAFAVVLAECSLRVMGVSYPTFGEVDDTLGYRLRPGMTGTYTAEGHAEVSINSHGWRDKARVFAKPEGVLRLAILGDSYAEAIQVDRERTFWRVVEKYINASGGIGGKQLEVLNFGVSGYGTAQELIALREHVWAYQPDYVLLAFLTGNDVVNNSKSLEPMKLRPFYSLGDGTLVLDDSFRKRDEFLARKGSWFQFKRRLKDYSRILQLVHKVRSGGRPPAQCGGEAGLQVGIYGDPKDDDWRAAWAITEALIAEMKREVAAKGAKLFVTLVTNGIQVHPQAAERKAFVADCGVTDLDYPNQRLSAFAQSERIPLLDLVPAFRQRAEASETYYHGFGDRMGKGHWNEAGHQYAGELIGKWLRAQLAQ